MRTMKATKAIFCAAAAVWALAAGAAALSAQAPKTDAAKIEPISYVSPPRLRIAMSSLTVESDVSPVTGLIVPLECIPTAIIFQVIFQANVISRLVVG